MSFYFREKPRFGDKLRGKSRDELMEELKQQFDEKSKSFFEPAATRVTRDPFERHTSFSRGFPFDDVEGFGRRGSDIRSHLDDLASRHPEFADHLLGSAWGDIPAFHNTGSLRNRRRRGSGSSSSCQGNPDEDARSQTSGSSANSAASGASGVSSHGGDPTRVSSSVIYNDKEEPTKNKVSSSTRRNPIPQYGFRNTVDIGQHRHDMENPDSTSDNRGQRSMSAPPENRQQSNVTTTNQQEQSSSQNPQNSQNTNQRFVTRVDITPQFVPPAGTTEKHTKSESPQNQQQKTQQSNVRHIPIFVEGRDEPVVTKNLETEHDASTWSYAKPQCSSPPKFHQTAPQFPSPPPQFHRPSHFNQHYAGGRARDWLPSFDEEFYPQTTYQPEPSGVRRQPAQQSFASHSPPRQRSSRQPTTERSSRRQQNETPLFNNQQTQQTNSSPGQQEEIAREEPRQQTQPKDPLEKIAEVQNEVDSLNEQVTKWNGKSRKEKDYMYLDEMLTRELIKLDDIDTEGKENVRQARRNTIKSIQNSISLLESKASINEKPGSQQSMEIQGEKVTNDNDTAELTINNDEVKANECDERTSITIPIPLPAVAAADSSIKEFQPEIDDTIQGRTSELENNVGDSASQEIATTEMDITPVTKVSSLGSMDIQAGGETEEKELTGPVVNDTSMEVENPKSPRTAKKIRKTKKQQQQTGPVCENAIPLPAPETHLTNVAE